MNYLAHAYLSPGDPMILMGNLWGDLLKPRDYPHLHEKILLGVERHQVIDTFTDQHEGVEEINRLVRPSQGKYTPVVTDVLMDYMLSKYWKDYHESSLEEYCRHIYNTVSAHLKYLPERIHQRILRMHENRWLESCANRDRMEITLQMLSRRAAFKNNIPKALEPYDLHEEKMNILFTQFFDDLQSHVNLQNEG